jgi:hypothetical protein
MGKGWLVLLCGGILAMVGKGVVVERPSIGALSVMAPESPFAFAEEVSRNVRLLFRGKPVWQYNYGVAAPQGAPPIHATSGFLHPVWNPKGVIVTDWGPPDHFHHRGIFFAWTRTRWGDLRPDFWNLHANTGRTNFEAFERLELLPDKAILIVRHRWEARKGEDWVPVMRERWTIVTYAPEGNEPAHWVFDLTTELVNITETPLVMEEYRYGGLGCRGNRAWMDARLYEVLNSEGKTRADADGVPARWVLMGGQVGEQWAGITQMDHPANLHFPNAPRLTPGVPFVGFAPPRKGEFVMAPHQPLVFRFRFVVHSVKPAPQELESLWQRFAQQR